MISELYYAGILITIFSNTLLILVVLGRGKNE